MSGISPRKDYRLSLALFLVFLAGCGSLLESDDPPASTWWLEPVALEEAAVSALAASGRDDLVLDLTVVPGLDTDRILNLDRQARLNHYAGALWPDHLPEVLGSVMARSLEAGGRVRVQRGERASTGSCLLRLEARSFYGRVTDAVTDRVEVAFSGDLTCDDERWPLEARTTGAVSQNRMSAIVAAFQDALDRATSDIAGAMGSS